MQIVISEPEFKDDFHKILIKKSEEDVVTFQSKASFKSALTKNDVFVYINEYWKSLPQETLDKLYYHYKEVDGVLNQIQPADETKRLLAKHVCDILDLHELTHLHGWLLENMERLDITIPESILPEYQIVENDNRGSREQTYIVEDYIWLLCLSIAIRSIIPIWAAYIDTVKLEVGNVFKELKVFQLIYNSNFYNSPPFLKLMSYVEHNLKPEDYVNKQHILNGINSSIFFEWLLAVICVNRLGVRDIRIVNPEADPVKYIYQYIRQQIEPNVPIAKQIKDLKMPESSEKVSDSFKDKNSTLEVYTHKQDIAQGEIVEIEHSISDILRCAHKLHYGDLDDNFVMSCVETARKLRNHNLSEAQIILLKWVFSLITSPKGISYISKNKCIDALGVTQAILWIKGHKYLALLSTCYADIDDRIMVINTTESKTKIPKEMINELNEIYPYSKIKKKNEVSNMVFKSITNLSNKFSSVPWTYTADENLVKQVCPHASNGILPLDFNLKILLTKLAIELGSRTF